MHIVGRVVQRLHLHVDAFAVPYRRLRDEHIFDGLCAVQSSKSRISVRRPGTNGSEPVFARLVSANYFDVLGTRS